MEKEAKDAIKYIGERLNEKIREEMANGLEGELLSYHTDDAVQGINQAALSRRRYTNGEINEDAFTKSVYQLIGVKLPKLWSGEFKIVGVSEQNGITVDAAKANIKPQSWLLYAQKDVSLEENAFDAIAAYPTEKDAVNMVEKLRLVDALGTENLYDRTLMLARIKFDRVFSDPSASEEEKSIARETLEDAKDLAYAPAQSTSDIPLSGGVPARVKGVNLNKVITMEKDAQEAIKYIGERLLKPDWEAARDLVSSNERKGFVYLAKPNAQYAGKIIMMSDTHLVQQVGKNSAVAHDLSKLENGAELTRQFDNNEIKIGRTNIKVEYNQDRGKANIVTYNQQRSEYVRKQAEKWAEQNITNSKSRAAFLKHVHAFTQDMAKGQEPAKPSQEQAKSPVKTPTQQPQPQLSR
ncbi:hypothetical protein Nstercoris_02321 (plasmid) [Nitrosomonas stercoris]|uniref:KfrB domain-containing protein n=1 Tax=Nitrosomonas stercoris TaxID=1444684 RepID=A0A4Y1YPD7_9PROT|nr:hypothetical protein Nstercoris_02321 [Nitrosomonas stercoris]